MTPAAAEQSTPSPAFTPPPADIEDRISELARTTRALRIVAWAALELDRPAPNGDVEAFVALLVRADRLAEELEEAALHPPGEISV